MVTQISANDLQSTSSPLAGTTADGGGRQKADEVSLIDILTVIALRKNIILWVTVVFAVTSAVISLILPRWYTATVSLIPPQQNSSVGAALGSQLGSLGSVAALAGGNLGLKNPNDMFVGMLRSRTVEDEMVQQYKLMEEYHCQYSSDARKKLERYVTIDGNQKDDLIHISVEDRNPKRAAELANGYVVQFRTLSEHLAITEAAQRRLFFEKQLEQAKDNLADAEEALKRTEQTTGLIQLDSQARALIESAATLRAQIMAKEVQIQSMQMYATDENAQVLQAEKELDGLRAQLAKLGGSAENNEASLILPKGDVPQAGLEYVRRLRDVKYYETIFEILARQFEFAKLDEAKQGALIQVVDLAIPPDKASFPRRTPIVIGSTAIGLVLGVFMALFMGGLESLTADPERARGLKNLRSALSFRR